MSDVISTAPQLMLWCVVNDACVAPVAFDYKRQLECGLQWRQKNPKQLGKLIAKALVDAGYGWSVAKL